MRLAVVSPFVDRRHGTERALAELLERLAGDYGCEIHLYSQCVEDLPVSDPKSAHSAESGVIFWHKVASIQGPHVAQFVAWMFWNGFQRKWSALFGGVSFDLVLSPGINCLHPDVVIVHALFHRLQELTREEKEDPALRGNFLQRLHRRVYYGLLAGLERRIYTDKSVSLAAVSQRTAGLLKGYFHRADVCVIQNGVDTEHFTATARLARRAEARQRRGFRDEDFVLLLIGNDWRVKGLPSILEAMAILPGSPLRLLVVGNDAAEPFRASARRLGVEERCLWEPSGPDVLDFYAAADVYVSPSREDSFGLPVAEAMACGLPVITSIFAGVADCIHDGVDGFIVRDPRDTRALAQLIERLQEDPDLRRNLGEAAADTVLQWDWNRNAAAVWELLRGIVAKRPPSDPWQGPEGCGAQGA
ncbi:MAG: glycosyltransferase family 4 protein [Candidatus Acidiferrales bacterium]